jgi:hypothetical protein
MQLDAELTTALLAEHGHDLRRRGEQRRMLSTRDRPVPSAPRARRNRARRALIVPRPLWR